MVIDENLLIRLTKLPEIVKSIDGEAGQAMIAG